MWIPPLTSQERHRNQATFPTPRKGFTTDFKNQTSGQKVKNMSYFVFLSFYVDVNNGSAALDMATGS